MGQSSVFHGFTIQSEAIVTEHNSQKPLYQIGSYYASFLSLHRAVYGNSTNNWKFRHVF